MAATLARALLLAVLSISFGAQGGAGAFERPLVVASKVDTEGALLGSMIVELLRRDGIPVESKVQFGPTKMVRHALMSGEIDIYPEYTGNAGLFFQCGDDPVWRSAAGGYEKARQLDARNGLLWLRPAPANNTWAIALRRDVADANHIRSLDDLAAWIERGGKMKLAASQEFLESPAALPAFEKAYGFDLSPEQVLVVSRGDTAATIRAAAESISGVNAAMAYGTDGALSAQDLVVLEDTKAVQPVYAPAPLVRAEALERYPQLKGLLEPVFASLTMETLQALNARIALGGMDAKVVAHQYLAERGFLASLGATSSVRAMQ